MRHFENGYRCRFFACNRHNVFIGHVVAVGIFTCCHGFIHYYTYVRIILINNVAAGKVL